MNDYEKRFIASMDRLRIGGGAFEALARAATREKFGGAAEVIFRDLSPRVVQDPREFVSALSRTFGRGAIGIYEPILRQAELGIFPQISPEPGQAEAIRNRLGRPGVGEARPKESPLHEHRVKDEQENYPDEAE